MATISQYNLPTIEFNPNIFQGTVFKPEPLQTNILQNSIIERENRKRLAYDRYAGFKKTLGDLRPQLHQDKETMDWFKQFAETYTNRVEDIARTGHYGEMSDTIAMLAAEAASNPELQGRIASNSNLNAFKQSVEEKRKTKEIGDTTANYYKAKAEKDYSFNPIKDNEGNIIGWDNWETKETPVHDLSVPVLFKAISEYIAPDKGSYDIRGDKTADNRTDKTKHFPEAKVILSGNQGVSASTQDALRWETITVDDIMKLLPKFITGTPDGIRQVEQFYNVQKWDYEEFKKRVDEVREEYNNANDFEKTKLGNKLNDLTQQLDARKRLFQKNGSMITDYNEFLARVIFDEYNKTLPNAVSYNYKYKTDSSSNQRTYYNDTNHVVGNGNDVQNTDVYNPPTKGTPTIQDSNNMNLNSAKNIGIGILNNFGNKRPVGVFDPVLENISAQSSNSFTAYKFGG